MKLSWSQRALDDLLDIGRFIARNDPRAARRWVERLRQRAQEAARNPRLGRIVPEYSQEDLREVILGAYRIVYRVQEDTIEVLTVFEGHRLLPEDVLSVHDGG